MLFYNMGVLGGLAGGAAGAAIANQIPGWGGAALGGLVSGLGALLPFEDGGYVKAPKGKGVPALLHGQEFVLPAGVKPTKSQRKAVKAKKAKRKVKVSVPRRKVQKVFK